MRFLVTGVTGNTGAATARHLLQQGHEVVALVRDVDRASDWAARGVKLVAGSLHNADDIVRALDGVEGVWALVPPQWGVPDYFAAQAPVTAAWIDALHRAPVARTVVLSSIAVHQAAGTGPIRSLRPLEAGLADVLGVTFLRAAYFQENLGGSLQPVVDAGVLPVFFGANTALDMVATEDIGAEAARLLLQDPATAPRIVNLAGPREETFARVATVLSDLLGRSVQVVEQPAQALADVLRGMGAGHLADLYAEMSAGVATGQLAWEPGVAVTRGATGIETTLRGMLAPRG